MTQKSVADKRSEREIFEDRMFELFKRVRASKFDENFLAKVNPGLQLLIEGGEILASVKSVKADWLTEILEAERQAHLIFFGRWFNLSGFEKTLRKYGRKKVRAWKRLGLEPHFLPGVSMMSGDEYPGWKVKPEEWFYKKLVEGKLFRDVGGNLEKVTVVKLEGITVLIDTRLKPAYDGGKQIWTDDGLLGEIIETARKAGQITKYEHLQSSRFGVSANEWEMVIKPIWAAKLGLATDQVRLETTIERNVIPQMYSHMPRKDDGKTDTSVWVEEYFEARSKRLDGGYSGGGGLADVYCHDSGGRWNDRSVRPLAVLKLEN